jgi:hypothetical protein
MNWDKMIDKMMTIDPEVAVRLAILDRQMKQSRVSSKEIQSLISETNLIADSVLKDFEPLSIKTNETVSTISFNSSPSPVSGFVGNVNFGPATSQLKSVPCAHKKPEEDNPPRISMME